MRCVLMLSACDTDYSHAAEKMCGLFFQLPQFATFPHRWNIALSMVIGSLLS